MDARCPLCTSVFQTERTGVQYCPSCGQQVNVADVSGAAPPPPVTGGGPGPQFFPPPGGGTAPPPGSTFSAGRGPTPWERRTELGFVSAFFETWKQTMFHPVRFFGSAEPNNRVWDAMLYAWIINIIVQLINVPLRLLGMGQSATANQDLSALPIEMRDMFSKLMEFTQLLESPSAILIQTFVSIALYPLLLVIVSAFFHLFCLMFGVAKNGYGATLRSFAYAASPLIFTIWLLAVVSTLYNLVLTIIGLSAMQASSGGRATAAVLTPYVVLCCCCCAGGMMFAMSVAGAASGMK